MQPPPVPLEVELVVLPVPAPVPVPVVAVPVAPVVPVALVVPVAPVVAVLPEPVALDAPPAPEPLVPHALTTSATAIPVVTVKQTPQEARLARMSSPPRTRDVRFPRYSSSASESKHW